MSNSEWQEMYCIEKHGVLSKGQKCLVKKLNSTTAEVIIRGKIIYEDPRYFQLNKPIIREESEEEEDEFYDIY